MLCNKYMPTCKLFCFANNACGITLYVGNRDDIVLNLFFLYSHNSVAMCVVFPMNYCNKLRKLYKR